MPQALYRKYRPQAFAEVIGQAHIKQTLLNQLKTGKVSHAYLFTGPHGIGKTTLARLIAKSINCLAPSEGEPCNACKACTTISKNQAFDIVEIDAASNTGVDNIRENIINNAHVAPSGLKNKVFIIDEIHMLSTSAFNALLKTLEEPPKNIIFILATTEIHKVPATIISRCQRFDFSKVPLKEIVGKLEKIVISENIRVDLEVLQRIAKNSEGCARDAESLLGQIIALDEHYITSEIAELAMPKTELNSIIDFFLLLLENNIKQALVQINQLVENGVDLQEFNKSLIEFLRKIMLYRITGNLSELEYLDIDKQAHENIVKALEKTDVMSLKNMIEVFITKIDPLKSSPIAQLPLELAIIEICEEATSLAKKKLEIKPESKIPEIQPVSSVQPATEKNVLPQFSNGAKPVPRASSSGLENKVEDKAALEDINNKMPKILEALRRKNHSLALTLTIAQLVAYDKNNTLTLGVKYKFHSDRICDPENLAIVESVFTEQLQRPVKVICMVDEKYENKNLLKKITKSDNLENASEEETGNVWDLAVNTFNLEEEKKDEEDNSSQ